MIRDLIEEASTRLLQEEGSHVAFAGKGYTAIPFSETNFCGIGAAKERAILFVDGGNAEIARTPSLTIQAMRNAAVTVKKNKLSESKKRDFYVLAHSTNGKTEAIIFDGKKTVVHAESNSLCDEIRRSTEILLAIELLGVLSEGDMIVLDGTLEAIGELEKRHLDELFLQARKRGILVSALAKTTTLLTDSGASAASVLYRKKEGCWYYHPVAQIESARHRAELCFVKLHEKSKHVFRFEIFNEQKELLPEAVASLCENSRDLTFPGYPYGLIAADQIARISNREAEYIRTKLFAQAGKKWEHLQEDMSPLNAHDVLDRM